MSILRGLILFWVVSTYLSAFVSCLYSIYLSFDGAYSDHPGRLLGITNTTAQLYYYWCHFQHDKKGTKILVSLYQAIFLKLTNGFHNFLGHTNRIAVYSANNVSMPRAVLLPNVKIHINFVAPC